MIAMKGCVHMDSLPIKEELKSIDWQMIKSVICGIASTLNKICAELPPGEIRMIVCGAASVLSMVCSLIPGQSQKEG